MHTLYINNASQQGHIALCSSESCLAIQSISSRISEVELVKIIEKILQEAALSYEQLDRVACVCGPGGFTSLRVGVTAANVLATTLHIPVAALHLATLYKALISQEVDAIWLHSTKKELLFIQGFGAFTTQWAKPQLVTVQELQQASLQQVPWCGELIEQHESALQLGSSLTLSALENVLPTLLGAQKYTPNPIVPWYGREG